MLNDLKQSRFFQRVCRFINESLHSVHIPKTPFPVKMIEQMRLNASWWCNVLSVPSFGAILCCVFEPAKLAYRFDNILGITDEPRSNFALRCSVRACAGRIDRFVFVKEIFTCSTTGVFNKSQQRYLLTIEYIGESIGTFEFVNCTFTLWNLPEPLGMESYVVRRLVLNESTVVNYTDKIRSGFRKGGYRFNPLRWLVEALVQQDLLWPSNAQQVQWMQEKLAEDFEEADQRWKTEEFLAKLKTRKERVAWLNEILGCGLKFWEHQLDKMDCDLLQRYFTRRTVVFKSDNDKYDAFNRCAVSRPSFCIPFRKS
ncbi:hypothetical protein RvY_02927 [Ramazzottius varieornatus]|uniref:Uncharacterized protein n=1 Tax=Ramazzottius varieornatus TaxID=947166 RepID=A0A1D1UM60_RAMVA|nr:hypothetical protein RvY_02927 [Ramazzottius varieornatus]